MQKLAATLTSALKELDGRKLLPLDASRFNPDELSTRERVVLMEKREIQDAMKWQDSREIRNSFAHDYPDQHREKAENFNAAWEYSNYLLTVTKNIEQYIQQHYGVGFCA